MNARKILNVLVFALFILVNSTQAQTLHTCASDHLNDTLLANDPIFFMGQMQLEEALEARRNIPEEERSDDLYTLPVVVHIIHKGEPYGSGTNITDEQIYSAITALNNDFRHVAGSNGDGSGPDIGIEFCLAVRDPNGQPTTGINRVDGRVVPLYETQGIAGSGTVGASETAVKALSTWPRASYVNIWVVSEIEDNNGGSGVQGYAYFPVNNPVDGIVLLYNAFGTVGTLKSYTNMNRTLTHEMGHYLNLYHTFHMTTACTAEGNCNTAGDRICDTPVTPQSSSCSTPACSGTQQVENYMDYTGQVCQDMFTEGQKLRMRTALETQRASMLTSMGCMAVNTRDAGITAVISPNGFICSGSVQPTVTLTNFGSATLTSVTLNYNLNGVGSNTQAWTGSLASGASTTVTLNAITPAGGAHTLYAWTTNPNGQTDQNTSNDQASGTFTVATGGVATLIVRLDYFGSETTWQITDANNVMLMNGGPYQDYAQGTQHTHNVCLPPGCYTLTFFDTHNDGQGFTNGNFRLLDAQGDTLVYQSGNWGQSSINPFCLVASSVPPVASMSIADNTICRNSSTNFTSTSTGSPTSYSWSFEGGSPATSTAQNPQNISYANAGTYDVVLTVSNANGTNTYTCTNCVTVYARPSVTLTGNSPACNNAQTGSVTSVVTGGATPYSYSWSNGATSANLNNVASGTYTLTVTDANSCNNQATATLTNPAGMTVTGTVTNIICAGANTGSITASATGGTGTKTYSWSNGATGATASGLAAGSYTVTVTDAGGCTRTQSFTVTAPTVITITGTTTNILCAGANTGSITVSATGGTGTKTFSWSNGANGATISNLAAGSYTVTATDANGCTRTQAYTITAPTAITVTGTATNIVCAGANTGSISVSATGGTGTKTFSWSNGANGATISNLAAGSYTVTATDANGCTRTQAYTITAPTAITITGTATNIVCAGVNSGSITVSATGGTGAKTFSWSNGATGATISNLAAGSYTVTATDANGCTRTQAYTITAPSAIAITGTVSNSTCSGSNGSITVSATGGTGSKTFSWSNGATGATVSNLAQGSYTVTATDASGCTATQTFNVNGSSSMVINGVSSNVTCSGGNNGSITVNVTGGTGSITYSWSNGSTNSTISNLTAGTYTVTALDASGCSIGQTYTISSPSAVVANVTDVDITCNGTTGSAQVNPTGGVGPYTVSWSNGATGNSVNGLAVGNYTVTVTDANNCSAQGSFAISQMASLAVSVSSQDVNCNGANDGSATATAQGGNGVYTYVWSNGLTSASISSLSPGTYGVVVTDGNGCQGTGQVVITGPSAIVVTAQVLDVACFGDSNGMISIEVSGGVGPYQYEWSNGAAGVEIDNLVAGNYTVTVTDANGCEQSITPTVSQPEMLTANIIVIDGESCAGNDGAAEVIASGGSEGYNIYWNNGASGSILEEVAAGEYSVTVIDENGCSIFAEVVIPYECDQVVPQTQLIPENCNVLDVPLDGLIYCNEVAGAEMYQWRFTNEQGIIISTEYSLGNVFYVSQIPFVQSGTKYYVGIKALVESAWGEYGTICSITTEGEEVIVIPGLSEASCGVVISDWGQTLIATEVPNIISYQWNITGNNYNWTTYTPINALVIEDAMQLIAGETYQVKMRCSLGQGQFTDWGPTCTFSIDMAIDVAVYPPIDGILHFYPNPSDGEKIIFDFGNLPPGSVVEDLAIYGISGSLIEKLQGGFTRGSSNVFEYYFQNKLASGMYVLRYKFNGRESEEKLMVR